ncbi:hypothetical protein [Microbacterium pumilum]|uniref:Uncharacterized protein n=1 Tax=Microbacterium pumilum TaxID=344165 RepID=A0ABN2T4V5_9MICO
MTIRNNATHLGSASSPIRALSILILLFLTSCASPAATSPTSSPTKTRAADEETHGAIDSGRILFAVEGSTSSGGTELRVLDGSELQQVVTGDPTLAHVAWAGGNAIVYDSEPTPGRRVFRRADYREPAAEPVAPDAPAGSADAGVSPDGMLVAFAASMPLDGGAVGLSVVPVQGGEAVRVTPPNAEQVLLPYDDYPSFSPDGNQIVYLQVTTASDRGDPLTGDLLVVPVSGGTPRLVASEIPSPGPPRFSPDGEQILFHRENSGGTNLSLWTVPASGGEPRELFAVPPHANAFNADWSPDGTQLVFEWYQDGWDRNELRVSNLDGSDTHTIWRGTSRTTAETPDWAA